MRTFKLYWKTGDTEVLRGKTFDEAFSEAGYLDGALYSLKSWSDITNQPKPQHNQPAYSRAW